MFIGIDGGGTKTKVMLVCEDMTVLSVSERGPSSIRTVPFDTSIHQINLAIQDCLKQVSNPTIKAVFAGLGDVTGDEDSQRVEARLRQLEGLKGAVIHVKNDVYNAHAGALDGQAGVAIIIGTGSVAFGIDESGRSHRAGGYSYKEGDLGSAYGLGKQALSVLGKALDHRVKSSPLTDALVKHYNLHTFMDVVALYDNTYTRRTDVAELAKMVTAYAQAGDLNALAIIDQATDELLLMIKAVNQQLNLKNKAIGIIGSLGNADTPHQQLFRQKVLAYEPRFNIFPAKKDPVYGSCVLAKQAWLKSLITPL